MITKNNRNIAIKKPITGVVPQPGATLPYSALSGRKISPNRVLSAIILSSRELDYIILVYNITHNVYYKQSFLFTSNLSNIIFMESAKILSIFISGLLLGITGYSIFTAFGPSAKELRDPFEEHED